MFPYPLWHWQQVSHFCDWDPTKYLAAATQIAAELRASLDDPELELGPHDGVTLKQCDLLDRLVQQVGVAISAKDEAAMRHLIEMVREHKARIPDVFSHRWGRDDGPPVYREARCAVAFRALAEALSFSLA